MDPENNGPLKITKGHVLGMSNTRLGLARHSKVEQTKFENHNQFWRTTVLRKNHPQKAQKSEKVLHTKRFVAI